jgi:hypothetical protein
LDLSHWFLPYRKEKLNYLQIKSDSTRNTYKKASKTT